MQKTAFDIKALSRDQRLALLEELWESLSRDPDYLPLTTEQREELDRRLDRLDQEGAVGIPWEQIQQEMCDNAMKR